MSASNDSESKRIGPRNWVDRLRQIGRTVTGWVSQNPGSAILLTSLAISLLMWQNDRKRLQADLSRYERELQAPELVYSVSWYPETTEPEEIQIRQAADALYIRFFAEVSNYLEANPEDDYEAVFEALLPMTATIPSAREGTLRVTVRNEGEKTEETIRVKVEASEGWTISSEKYEGTESARIIEGGEGYNSIKHEVDRLVPNDQFEIKLSFHSTEEFPRQLTIQRRPTMEDFEWSVKYGASIENFEEALRLGLFYGFPAEWQVDQGIHVVATSASFPDVPPQVEVTGASGKARESSSP